MASSSDSITEPLEQYVSSERQKGASEQCQICWLQSYPVHSQVDTEEDITAKIEKDNYVRIASEEEQEGRDRGKQEGKEEERGGGMEEGKDPQSILEKSGVCLPGKKTRRLG